MTAARGQIFRLVHPGRAHRWPAPARPRYSGTHTPSGPTLTHTPPPELDPGSGDGTVDGDGPGDLDGSGDLDGTGAEGDGDPVGRPDPPGEGEADGLGGLEPGRPDDEGSGSEVPGLPGSAPLAGRLPEPPVPGRCAAPRPLLGSTRCGSDCGGMNRIENETRST